MSASEFLISGGAVTHYLRAQSETADGGLNEKQENSCRSFPDIFVRALRAPDCALIEVEA